MTDVKVIFNNTYKLYSIFKDEALFHAIISNLSEEEPNTVKGILADTYNFYIRWKDAKDEDAEQIHQEAKELNKKYDDCDLCRRIIVEICTILNQNFKKGNK